MDQDRAAQSETTSELMKALVKAQGDISGVEKDSENKHHKYSYASAESMISAVRGPLMEAGIVVIPVAAEVVKREAWYVIRRLFRVAHVSGQFMEVWSEMPIVPGRGRPEDKATAASLTASLNYFVRDLLMVPRFDKHEDMDNDYYDRQRDRQDREDRQSRSQNRQRSRRRDTPNGNGASKMVPVDYVLKMADPAVREEDVGTKAAENTVWQSRFLAVALDGGKKSAKQAAENMDEHQTQLLRLAWKHTRDRRWERLETKIGDPDAPIEALAEDAGVNWPGSVSKLSPFDLERMEKYYDKMFTKDS